jgi:uncharacterized protein YndB with AHSA1/START domain
MAADSIEREIVINASRERVWPLLTEPEHMSRWFGDSTEADLRPGGALAFTWAEFGSHLGVVERIDPPSFFSYRWARPTGAEPVAGNSTLAEFTLIADGPRTRLRVVESGFASLDLSAAEREQAIRDNIEGWRRELDELRAYAEQPGFPASR